MNNLPIAAFVVTRLVQRQFADSEPDAPASPTARTPQPVRRTRVAVAGALEWAARVVAPDGYRVAH